MKIPTPLSLQPVTARALILAASAILLALGQFPASAQTTYNFAAGGGAWTNPLTWSPNSPAGGPTSVDSLNLTIGKGVLVDGSTNYTIASMTTSASADIDFNVYNVPATPSKNIIITGDLTKNGTGALLFRGSNPQLGLSVGGNLAVNQGVFAFGGVFNEAGAGFTVTGNTTVASGATLSLQPIFGSTFGTMTLNGTLQSRSYYGFDAGINIAGLSGSGTISPIDFDVRTSNVTFTQTSGSYDFTGAFVQGGATQHMLAVVKNGAGTQSLSGNSNYTGTTTVNTGTLLINGDNSAATGAVSVALNATLGGSGTIGANTTIAQGGILAAGTTADSTTTLALNTKDLIIGGNNSKLNFDITGTGAGAFDKVVGIASFTQNGDVTFQLSGAYGTNSWDVLDFASKTGNFDTVTLAGSYVGSLTRTGEVWAGTVGGQAWTFDQTSGVLGVVPEPSTWLLLAFGLTTVITLRRRRA